MDCGDNAGRAPGVHCRIDSDLDAEEDQTEIMYTLPERELTRQRRETMNKMNSFYTRLDICETNDTTTPHNNSNNNVTTSSHVASI